MPWSEGVFEQFDIVDPHTTEESDFYGPFNTLLAELFPSSEHYQISPKLRPIGRLLDFTVDFVACHRRTPVFVLEVKTLRSLTQLSTRGSADEQMRQMFRELASGPILIPTLYGVSAFGPQFCVYALESATGTISPPAITRDLNAANDAAPEAQWAYNLLEPAGEEKLREVVCVIKEIAAGL
ncbi:hypothetical protein H0H81_000004 [Sphagnurus paluster]|uniref:Uncharacterized protein n=1 Tax=Sphagnurus paluster TaxID=117069 RepID=A0A9P7FYX9_9AGAR|nr:hypothetical protein H0H81_000004 [Sphagnurus paluster]